MIRVLYVWLINFGLVFIAFCFSSHAEFKALRSDKIQPCDAELEGANQIVNDITCEAIVDTAIPLEIWQTRLRFNLGHLTEDQFHQLKDFYGSWNSQKTSIGFDPTKSYQLKDFLPPIIQAIEGHRFIPEATHLPKQLWTLAEQSAPSGETPSLYSNCWGILYEVLRSSNHEPVIFIADQATMLEVLRNKSTLLASAQEPEALPFPVAMRPGDILLISHTTAGMEYLDHVALVLDQGIFFEKAGSGAEVPIRIVEAEVMHKMWRPGVFQYELRRPHRDAVWNDPAQEFSLRSRAILRVIPEYSFLTPELGFNFTLTWQINADKRTPEEFAWFGMRRLAPLIQVSGHPAKLHATSYLPSQSQPYLQEIRY